MCHKNTKKGPPRTSLEAKLKIRLAREISPSQVTQGMPTLLSRCMSIAYVDISEQALNELIQVLIPVELKQHGVELWST